MFNVLQGYGQSGGGPTPPATPDYSVQYQSGLALYSLVFNDAGQAWNGSAFVDRSTNWAACSLPMTDDGSGTYSGSMPATLPSGTYLVQSYLQEGDGPVEGDNIVGTGTVDWNGSAPGSPVDLATALYVTQVLSAGGVTITAAQSVILGSLITAASREMARYINRPIPLMTYTEIVVPEGGRQDRGEPASAKLSAFPVVKTLSVMTRRATVLTVTNNDAATNQFAQVGFAVTGDVEYLDLVYTGLELTRMASGVSSTSTASFASNLTLASLATAINALGHGWSARVEGNYGPWPSASLVGVREPKDALSQGACLELFTKPARSYEIIPSTGIMRCSGWDWFGGFGFGGGWDDGFGGGLGYGGVLGSSGYRVTYQAGWATIPANLQQICAEVVKGMIDRLSINNQVKTMSGGSDQENWSWTARDAVANLPDWAIQSLNHYKDGWI